MYSESSHHRGVNSPRWLSCRPLWFRIPRILRILWIISSLLCGPFRRRFNYNPSQIHVLLLVRDLYSEIPNTVNTLLSQGILPEHILLLDSGSTNPSCLNTLSHLEQCGCKWVRLQPSTHQFGPYASWMCPILNSEINSWKYPFIVSDTDLSLPPGLPSDWLQILFETINANRGIQKSSLPLRTDDITCSDKLTIQRHEASLSLRPLYRLCSFLLLPRGSESVFCPTDTTLSLYRPNLLFSTFSIRLPMSYGVRHLPWYQTFNHLHEYHYYQDHKLSHFGEWS